ncbi:hypothetical protein RhiirC2_763807 [Rhizophagus irregularis]|uniref:Uncharacterized protein n=1 Tax=Rhizophagus irregularis TaxID=588596 RepID=A0A2N1M7X3_9GLOM|nr:hypothetical protein RhiirC2_763807 [Rhizophagus irregularis]
MKKTRSWDNTRPTHTISTTTFDPPPRNFIGNRLPSSMTDTFHLPAITLQPILSIEGNTWHAKLGILIPDNLLPYVTEDPIYVSKRQEKLKGKQHALSSKAWLAVIKEYKEYAERNLA